MNSSSSHTGALRLWLHFLGSMNLAITLLVGVALASVIGTVLKQNQPYQDYLVKFGPFWYEVFRSLGLYDLYSSPWFLLILAFLVVSTGTGVYRNTPAMFKAMRDFRENLHRRSLEFLTQKVEWDVELPAATAREVLTGALRLRGYRVRAGGIS